VTICHIAVPVLLLGMAASCASTGGVPAASQATKEEALALVAQARLRIEAGEVTEGIQLFRRAEKADPSSDELAEEFGLTLAELGIAADAKSELSRAKQLSPAGEAMLGLLLAQSAETPAQLEAALPHLERGLDADQAGERARLILVQSLLRLGRGQDAWDRLQVLLGDRPEDPRLQIAAGEALRLMGRFDEAVEYLKEAAKQQPAEPRATLDLIETLADQKKYGEAADLLTKFLETHGATLEGLTRLATLRARAGDHESAIKVLDDVLVRDGQFRDALMLRAILAATGGDPERAEQFYRRALAVDPGDPDASLGLARVLMDAHRLEEARPLLLAVWDKVQGAKIDGGEPGVEVAQELATLELLDRASDAARPWLDRLAVLPLDRRSLALWAEYFRQRKAWADGAAWLPTARLEDGPELKRARAALEAEFALGLGDDERARALLAPLLEGDADDVLAALGTLQRVLRHSEVAADARVALERFPDNEALRFALAASLERSGKFDEAVAEFRKVIAAEPENASALNYLGYMFADRGVNLEEAQQLVEKAVKLEPTSGAYQDSLGWVYFRLGQLGLAEKHLTMASRLEPNDATVAEHLGDVYRALGQLEQAVGAYRRALKAGPEEAGQQERITGKLTELGGNEPQ